MEDTVVRCPRCAAVVTMGEKFCAACGTAVVRAVPAIDDPVLRAPGRVPQDPVPRAALKIDPDASRRLGNARKWLLAMSILQFAGSVILFAISKSAVDEQIEPGVRYLQFAITCGLGAAFFALWLWSKRNVLAACVTALLLYVTVVVTDGVLEPATA